MMNLNYLRTFILVVDKQSFSATAKILFLSQPAVTLQIQTLEENLGMQLLIRKGKSLVLTEAGEIVYQQAKKILDLWEETKSEVYKISKVVKGRLVVGASTIPGEYLLPQLIGGFHSSYPEVELSLEIANSEEIVERTLAGEMDLGIIGSFILHDKLETYRLTEDQLVLIVSSHHPWAQREWIELEEIKGESFILRHEGSGTRKVMEQKLKERGIDVSKELKVAMELGTTEAIINGVGGGWGISFVSQLAAKKAVDVGQVKIVKIKDFTIKRDLYLLFSSLKARKAVVREFIKYSQASI